MSRRKFDNPLEALVGYQLRRASSAQMESLSRRLDAHGLRPTDASMLVLIGANPGIKQTDLGRCLGIQRANMTPLTASLEKRGLIVREAVDGRSHGLFLTAEGETKRAAAFDIMQEQDRRLLEDLEPGRQPQLAAFLSRVWLGAPDGDN